MFSERLVGSLRRARHVAVLTGAGISAESGVPTFRGERGLWKKHRPEDLATFDAFARNPNLVWEWYEWRRKLISEVEPNPGHFTLARMEDRVPVFDLITQNVDGLHARAGSRNIRELHGNIMRSRCVSCGRKSDTARPEEGGGLPRCECGELMRPDVVWFGEMLPEEVIHAAFGAADACDLFLSVGTSALVQPAASLPLAAGRAGAYVVEINVERTVISDRVDESIVGASGEILPRLFEAAWELSKDRDGRGTAETGPE